MVITGLITRNKMGNKDMRCQNMINEYGVMQEIMRNMIVQEAVEKDDE